MTIEEKVGQVYSRAFTYRGTVIEKHCSVKLLAAATLAATSLLTDAASIAPIVAQHGMVVSAQHLATRVGVDVLKRGGNAVADAVGY